MHYKNLVTLLKRKMPRVLLIKMTWLIYLLSIPIWFAWIVYIKYVFSTLHWAEGLNGHVFLQPCSNILYKLAEELYVRLGGKRISI